MQLGLSIQNCLLTATLVTNGGDFVWQNNLPISDIWFNLSFDKPLRPF